MATDPTSLDLLAARRVLERRNAAPPSDPALGVAVVGALDSNPDEVAAARALARRSGMPLPLAQQDPREAERAARIRELNLPGLEERSPGLSRALMNPDLAQVAHDDIEKLSLIERYTKDIKQDKQRGDRVLELGNLGFDAIWSDDPSREFRIRELNAQQAAEVDYDVDPGGAAGFLVGLPGAAAEALPMMASGVVSSVKYGAAGAAGGAAIGAGLGLAGGPAAPATVPAGAVTGAVTGYGYGATVGLFVSSAKMEAGHSFLELRDMTDDQGRPIDRRLAGGLSLAVGIAAGGVETWGLGKLFAKIPGADKLTGAGMRAAARQAVANPAFRRFASQLAGTMTESAITEGATEGLQELIAIGGELTAGLATGKGLQDFTFEAPGPDGQTIVLKGTDAILARVLSSAAQGAQMGAGIAGAGQTARLVTDSERARAAVAKLPGIERLTRSAQESKLRERDPEAFKTLVKQVAEEAQVDSVYVAPEAMRTYFESISPEEAQALAADIPAIGQQQEEVARTGADVRLSLEDWLAHPEMAEALRDHVRFDPLEMTHKEALGWQEDLERQVGDLQDVVEGAKTEKDALALVGEHMRAELLKVYPETVVGPMTEFIVDRYRTRAQRLGVPVAELVQQEGLPRIEGPHQGADQKGALPPTLEDKLGTIRDEESVRRVLGDMRAKRLPKLTRGTPIVDLLRTRGGVRPDSVLAGELENMGFKRSGEGSFGGLITAKGRRDKFTGRRREPIGDLDNLVANEHPELAAVVGTDETGEYLNRQGLLDELARELRGESRVVDPMEEQALRAAQEEQAAVQAVLDEMGVPLDRADDAVVAKLTQRFSSREFNQAIPEDRISTRNPTGKRSLENPLAEERLEVTTAAMRELAPDTFEKNVAAIRAYTSLRPREGETAEQTVRRFQAMVKENLRWLWDRVPEATRERTRHWYVGANRLAEEWAGSYGHPLRAVAGAIAAMSPQKDWYMNVSLAERVLDVLANDQDHVLTDEEIAGAIDRTRESLASNKNKTPLQREAELAEFEANLRANVVGKPLSELGDQVHAAMFVRARSQAIHDASFRAVSPEGHFGGVVMGKKGPAQIAWGPYDEVGRAISILRDPSRENISATLGKQHKVRSFYNNILDPTNAVDVTIDTHAVAAALLKALSSTGTEVTHNFGGTGSSSSIISGTSGTYAIYADAYRELAAELGVLPRELQSVTWEAVRSLFTSDFKSDDVNVKAVEAVWSRYHDGKLSAPKAREAVNELAGGFHDPDSVSAAQQGDGERSTSFAAGVRGARPVAGAAARGSSDAAGRDVGVPAAGALGGARGALQPGVAREFQQRVAETHEEAARTPEFKAWAGDAEVVLDPESHTFLDGQPVVVSTYHGTTHEFDTIDTDLGEVESDIGRAFYSSTSRSDSERNYAGIGPDLTQRLERETEYLESVIPDDPTAYGLPEDADGVAIRSRAEELAREKLVGKAGEQGKVIPVFVKLQKPALIGSTSERTIIDLESSYDEELDEYQFNPNAQIIFDAAHEAESNYFDFNATDFLDTISEYVDRGAISAEQLVNFAKFSDVSTEDGALAGGQFAQDLLRAFGYDGVIVLDAQERFRGMDIGAGAHHVVVFEPTGKNVKAVQSQAFNPQSANIYREGHRGSIRMTDDLTEVIIRFTEAQDLSTFLHESGHLFLAQLEKDAARDEGQLDADLATVKDWARAQVGTDDLTSDAVQELWARSFEAYLMEGKAPSLSLERAFARFASWLVRIYKRLRGIPGYRDNLTPEIRGVMDRLLATDEQIAEAAEARGLAELDAQALGMTEEQAAKYREQVADGMGEAKRALQVQLMAQLERQKTREWKKLREEVRAEVEADVNSRPVFQAAHWLAKGEPLEGAPAPGLPEAKLDATALVELYGKEIKKALPRRYWAKEGLHPDVVAEAFGFPDGDALVRALEAAGNRADVIEAETDALMEKRHGTLQTSAQLEDAAVEALANAKQLRALKTAERAIAAKAGGKVIPIAITRATAQRLVRSTRYRDLTPARYRAAALKASRDVVRMIAKGEFPEAQTAIRQQILNLVMEAEARKAMTEADKAVDYLNRVQKRKSRERIGKAGADYLEQIDGMLERFDLRQHQSLRKIDRTTALAQWIAEQEAAGEEVIIPPKLRNEAFKQSWKELSIDDLLALRDSVKNLEHLARRKNEFLANRERRQREAVQADLVAATGANLPGRSVPNDMTPGKVEQLRRTLLSAEGSLVKMEFLIDLLDGGDPMGPWRANVFTPIAEAQAERYDLSGEYTHRLGELMAELVKGREALFARKWAAPQTGNRVTMWNVIGIALNVGNEGNYRNLVEGNRLSEGAIKSLLDEHMTEADWTFVRETWKLIDSLWPRIAEQERRLTGVVPEKVTGRTVSTPFGEFEGGYFPIVRDPDKSEAARRNADKGLYDGIETAFQRAITGHGFTIERTGATGPLLLDLAVIPAHLDAVIHDLTHRDVLMQIDKLLAGKPIVDIFGESGRAELYRLFRPWLQGIAKDRIVENRALAGMAGLLRVLRANTSSFALGFRATTLAMQVSGHSNAYGLLREKLPNAGRWIGVGIKKAFAGGRINGMREHFANVLEVSGEMRHRIGNIDRDLRDVIRRNQGENTIPARVRTAAMELIGQMQMFAVDLPVWSGAYEGAVRELGYSHEDAVTFADSIIRMSQGAAGAKDLSAIQRADEGYKQFLTFFSYRNLVYNQIVSAGRRVRAPRDVGRFLATWAFSITIPFVYAALVRQAITGHGGLPGDDDDGPGDWIAWFIASNLAEFVGTAPYVADLAGVARAATGEGRFFMSATPTQRVAEAVGDLAVPKDVTDVTFDALRVSAMLTGMPADWALKLSEEAIRESD